MEHVPAGKLHSDHRPAPSSTTALAWAVNETPMAKGSVVLV